MTYRQTHSRLSVGSLTQEQHARTCGYWYVVQEHMSPHTAFADRAHLQRWADERGLTLPDLPAKGEWAWGNISGEYQTEMHGDAASFDALRAKARHTVTLSNGDYTRALITEENGLRVIHYCNPNVREREVFPYHETRKRIG